jgi:hypothetical protein
VDVGFVLDLSQMAEHPVLVFGTIFIAAAVGDGLGEGVDDQKARNGI